MRTVLARVLERTALRAADRELAKVQFRAITLAPRDGVRVVQDRRRRLPPLGTCIAASRRPYRARARRGNHAWQPFPAWRLRGVYRTTQTMTSFLQVGYAPVATGRSGSRIQSLQDPR